MENLNDRQQRFCEEYIIDLNATKAAERAGYSERTANEQGARLLANVSVQAKITELKTARSFRTGVTSDMVLQELATIGFANVTDFAKVENGVLGKVVNILTTDEMPVDKVRSIAALKTTANGLEIKMHDKVKALELLGRHLGIFEKDNSQKKDAGLLSPEVVAKLVEKINSYADPS